MSSILGIGALRTEIRSGNSTIKEVLTHSFNRAHALQPLLNAFRYLPPNLVVGGMDISLPLAGISVAVKDVMDTADMPTAYGSPIHQDHRPQEDAWVVQRLRQLGAHVLGKSVTTEFAWRHPGNTVNPWNAGHTPGGSSSGSAAAVAAGITPLGLGTQTLGSVIRPAAYCGVVGFKPTFGSIPLAGICPLAESLDHVGLFARDVADINYVFRLLATEDADRTSGQPAQTPAGDIDSGTWPQDKPLRIGVLNGQLLGEIDACQAALMQDAASRFASAGAVLIDVELDAEFGTAAELAVSITAYEAARIHEERFAKSPQLLSAPMIALIEKGRETSSGDYLALKARQKSMQQGFARWNEDNGLDLLLLPPASGEAPQGLGYTGDPRFCSPFTLLGIPAISLPAGLGPNGLPLGIQLLAGRGKDMSLLRAAQWFESIIKFPVKLPI
jgi:Asp-tRNA(Asn)/Glu-tRNA(Gln) amidotransferase A subunit family amidase